MKYEFAIAPRSFDWNAGWQDWLAQKSNGEKADVPSPRCFVLLFLGWLLGRESQLGLDLPQASLHLVQGHGGRLFLLGHHLDQGFGQNGRIPASGVPYPSSSWPSPLHAPGYSAIWDRASRAWAVCTRVTAWPGASVSEEVPVSTPASTTQVMASRA